MCLVSFNLHQKAILLCNLVSTKVAASLKVLQRIVRPGLRGLESPPLSFVFVAVQQHRDTATQYKGPLLYARGITNAPGLAKGRLVSLMRRCHEVHGPMMSARSRSTTLVSMLSLCIENSATTPCPNDDSSFSQQKSKVKCVTNYATRVPGISQRSPSDRFPLSTLSGSYCEISSVQYKDGIEATLVMIRASAQRRHAHCLRCSCGQVLP